MAATQYLLDLNTTLTQVLNETTNASTTWYLRGLHVVAQQNSAGWTYFHQDGLGSIRQTTDATATVRFGASYDPYGTAFERAANVNTSLGYTGEQTDSNGLVYLRARYLNTSLGAFTSRDSVEGVMGRSITRNAYSYAGANPINYADHSGKFFWAPFLIAGLIGVGVGAFIAARYYDAASSGKCGCDLQQQMQGKDRTQFILENMFNGGLFGLGFSLLTLAIPVVAVAALGAVEGLDQAEQALKNICTNGANPCNWDLLNVGRISGIVSGASGLIHVIKGGGGGGTDPGSSGSDSEGSGQGGSNDGGDGTSSGVDDNAGSLGPSGGGTGNGGTVDWEQVYWKGWQERMSGPRMDARLSSNPDTPALRSIVHQLAQVIAKGPELQAVANAHTRLKFPWDPIWNNTTVGETVNWAEGNNSSGSALEKLSQVDNPTFIKTLVDKGFSRSLAIKWRDFYVSQAYADGANPVAPGRALLMERIAEQLH